LEQPLAPPPLQQRLRLQQASQVSLSCHPGVHSTSHPRSRRHQLHQV
jgi:hypothetical protein